jgi:hypothetical protein
MTRIGEGTYRPYWLVLTTYIASKEKSIPLKSYLFLDEIVGLKVMIRLNNSSLPYLIFGC